MFNFTGSSSKSEELAHRCDDDAMAGDCCSNHFSGAAPATLEEATEWIRKLRQRVWELESTDAGSNTGAPACVRQPEPKQRNPDCETILMLKSAIDQCSEAIFFTDINGTILYVNQSFIKSTQYSREELIGQTPRIIKSGHHPLSFYKKMWGELLAGQVFRCRMYNKRKDGSIMVADANNAPVRSEDGKIIGFVSVRTDITDLLENQSKLEAANRELSRSNADLQQFAYVASHDLQEPLRSISSCIQLLKKHYAPMLDAQAGDYIAHVVAGCQRMRDRIEALLSMSRVDAAFGQLEVVNSAEALDEVLANLSHKIQETGARITHDKLPEVYSCRQLLPHLFQNLLSNAIKFRGSKPPVIHVGVKSVGDQWQFSITDQGIGIDPQFFERIFRLFQRLHTQEEYSGTGLGLAICEKIVAHHGGRIWVESAPSHGSTFYFTLPSVPVHKTQPKLKS